MRKEAYKRLAKEEKAVGVAPKRWVAFAARSVVVARS